MIQNYVIKFGLPGKWNDELASIFGQNNEGVPVAAPDEKNAVDAFNCAMKAGQQFNPFYLKVVRCNYE